MDVNNSELTEVEIKIIEAANKVILRFGVDSTTMGQIADEAGISRTSLNYYYRNKQHLFQKVLSNLENKIVPTISQIINDDSLSLINKIDLFIDQYNDLIMKYPMVPTFILVETQRQQSWVMDFIKQRDINFKKLIDQITSEVALGNVIPFQLEDLFVNVIGLSLFPTLSQPFLRELFFNHNETELSKFMANRNTEVKRIIRNWLKPD